MFKRLISLIIPVVLYLSFLYFVFNKEIMYITIPLCIISPILIGWFGYLIGCDRLSIFPFKWRTEKEAAIFAMINSKVKFTSKEYRDAFQEDLNRTIDEVCAKKDI